MTANDSLAALTVGSVQVANEFYWDGTYWPYWPYPSVWPNTAGQITVTTTPVVCSGDVHVWACEHAEKCRCGKAHRKPEPKKCLSCGK
jgi:hypothetical protein